MPTAKPTTIAQYIQATPKSIQPKLREMAEIIRAAAPGAVEGLKWGMPAFSYRRVLVVFAAFKHHVGFYPTPSAIVAFEKELKKFVTAKGSIQFPHDKPLPKTLIRKITRFRVAQSVKDDKKWKTDRSAA